METPQSHGETQTGDVCLCCLSEAMIDLLPGRSHWSFSLLQMSEQGVIDQLRQSEDRQAEGKVLITHTAPVCVYCAFTYSSVIFDVITDSSKQV